MSDTLLPATLDGVDPPFDARVEALCTLLADVLGERDGRRPKVSVAWRRDMRLLCQRGPVGVEAAPVDTAEVDAVIRATFQHETWWADRVTGPAALRKHYVRIAREAASASRRRAAPAAAADMIAKLRGL